MFVTLYLPVGSAWFLVFILQSNFSLSFSPFSDFLFINLCVCAFRHLFIQSALVCVCKCVSSNFWHNTSIYCLRYVCERQPINWWVIRISGAAQMLCSNKCAYFMLWKRKSILRKFVFIFDITMDCLVHLESYPSFCSSIQLTSNKWLWFGSASIYLEATTHSIHNSQTEEEKEN